MMDAYGLQKNLSKLFQCRVINLNMSVEEQPLFVLGSSQTMLDHVGHTYYTLEVNMVEEYSDKPEHKNMLRSLSDITNIAWIVSVQTHVDGGVPIDVMGMVSPIYRHQVIIKVADLDKFEQDIKDVEWKRFESQFTTQLEDTLSKE